MFARKRRSLVLILITGMLWTGVASFASDGDQPVLFVGQNPDAVYRAINQARWRIDIDTLLACLSRRSQISREALYTQIMQGRVSLPEELRLLHVTPSERVTTLYYLGIREDRHDTGKTFYWRGAVTLVKEAGTWRLRHETWKAVPSPFPDAPE